MADISFFGDILFADSAFDLGFGFRSRSLKKTALRKDILPAVPSDCLIANYEAVISDSTERRDLFSNAHRTEPQYLEGIGELPVKVFNIANNHIMDHGGIGAENTCRFLSDKGFGLIGQKDTPWHTVELDKTKISVLAASLVYDAHLNAGDYYNYLFPICPINESRFNSISQFEMVKELPLTGYFGCSGGMYIPLLDKIHKNLNAEIRIVSAFVHAYSTGLIENPIKAQIEAALKESSACIVYLHWGNEYVDQYAQWQREYAEMLIDYGAVAVVGCHSHVLQPSVKINNVPVYYSLGNTFFNTNNPAAAKGGVALLSFDGGKLCSAFVCESNYDERIRQTTTDLHYKELGTESKAGSCDIEQYIQNVKNGINRSRTYKRKHLLRNITRVPIKVLWASGREYLTRLMKRAGLDKK